MNIQNFSTKFSFAITIVIFFNHFVPYQKAEENMSSKEVLLNTYPVTLINVDEKLVYQTIYASVHAIKRRDNLKTEASMLLHGTELTDFPTR